MSRKKKNKPGYNPQPHSAQFNRLRELYLQAQQLQQQGYLGEAEKLYREILAHAPDQPDALHYLGLVYMEKGDDKQAESYIKRSLTLTNNPVYFGNYGFFLTRQRKHEAAIEQYKKALELQPNYAEGWFNLGVSYSALGNLTAAEEAYEKAISFNNNYVKAMHNLACVQEAQGKSAEAQETIKKIQAIVPDTADIYYKLGLAFQLLGGNANTHKAYEYFRKALEIEPSSLEFRIAYARLLSNSNYIEAALDEYRNVLNVEPDYQNVRIEYGLNLIRDNQIKMAEEELSMILKKSPDNISAMIGTGNIQGIKGNFSDAETIYNRILTLDKYNERALFGIVNNRKMTDKDNNLIKTLQQVSTKNNNSVSWYALGKIYNDLDDYDSAFDAYKKANVIKNSRIDYNRIEHSGYVDKIISVFTRDFVESRQINGNPSGLPVFIVGTPRSGTTLTEQIISSHPLVAGAGELKYIGQLAVNRISNQHSEEKYPERIFKLTPEVIQKEAGIYLEKIKEYQERDGILRITDKMPGNFLYIGYILILLPQARIIHCQRNPLDACLSMYFQNFQSSHQYSFDLENLGHWYKDYLRLMEHWNRIAGDRILNIDYDGTVNATEVTARKLIEFCGLEWDEKCLEFYKSKRDIRTASLWQARQPIYKTSLERWKRYDNHIGVLKEILAGHY